MHTIQSPFFRLRTKCSGHIQVKTLKEKMTFIKCKNNCDLTFKVHCGFDNTGTRTPGVTQNSLPGTDLFLFLKDIYLTLHCRWRWKDLEICIRNTYRIYGHFSCYWTHDFYEILVNFLTNAFKHWWFLNFLSDCLH